VLDARDYLLPRYCPFQPLLILCLFPKPLYGYGTPVLMVLGHERCGAVTAAVKNQALPGEISSFVEAILPAVDQVKGQPGDAVDNAVIANVYYQIEQLKRSLLLTEQLQSGKLKIVGGRYDLDTGTVTIIT